MLFAITLTFAFVLVAWLVFFKFKWLKFSIPWAIVSAFFFLHILLIFLIGLRFATPYTANARVVQPTIQLVPRLPEPTLVTAVLVEPDVLVKKGELLFQFDRKPYEDKVRQLEAELDASKQHVKTLQADTEIAAQKEAFAKATLNYQDYFVRVQQKQGKVGVVATDQVQLAIEQQKLAQAGYDEAIAVALNARIKAESEIQGVNTTVAAIQSQLDVARYYLGNTTMAAPEDGRIVNLQVRPGMVAGEFRIGAIASFICEADRYLLANYDQESLKFVAEGQPVEVALDLYPGQIFTAKVAAVWKANGTGQLLPSGTLPVFQPAAPETPQNQYAVKIVFDGEDQSMFPIGAQGAAAIYTGGMKGGWPALRRIGIRTYSWMNWLYPLPF